MIVLYRKYRPQTFAEVSGQEHIKVVLEREVASGRLAHAYLFTGPRGVGKTSLARILAKAANCTGRAEGSGEPCGECQSCREITDGRSLDVIEIDAASHTGVDNVREQIVERVRQAPNFGRYRLYIIDEVHMLSGSAFNALLKTLEEPPEHAIFILATTELHKVPATVVSRCQRFDFRKIPREEIDARIRNLCAKEGVEIAPEVLEAINRGSEGCLRDAESLLSQLLATGSKNLTALTVAGVLPMATNAQVEDLARAVLARDALSALALWDELARSGAELSRILVDLIEVVRRVALASLRGTPEAGLVTSPALAAATLRRLSAVRDEMRRAEVPELPFEMMLMEWVGGEAPVKASARSEATQKPAVSMPAVPKPAAAPAPLASAATQPPEATSAPGNSQITIIDVRNRWVEVLRQAQEKHHSLPYMLAATELLDCTDGVLTLGFQYVLYRDRLNEARHRGYLEASLKEVLGAPLRIKAILLAQKVDGTVEPAPTISIAPDAKLPDGFADLAKEFGAN
jgi:DNA polymerase-3 subunit gamma/tau